MTQELIEFNITETAIEALKHDYMPLKIDGIHDKDGYKNVVAARKHVKTLRVSVDKRRKELTEEALRHQQSINREAKRITALIEPIEDYLGNQEREFDMAVLKAKQEKAEAIQRRSVERIKRLVTLEYSFDGAKWNSYYLNVIIKPETINNFDDEEFNRHFDLWQELYNTNKAVHVEQLRQAEEDRLAAEFDAQMKREEEAAAARMIALALKQERRLLDEKAAFLAKQENELREEANRLKLIELEKQEAEEDKDFSMETRREVVTEIVKPESEKVVVNAVKFDIEYSLSDKYRMVLEFIKQISVESSDDDLFEDDIILGIDGEEYTKSQFYCSFLKVTVDKLLKEIGEL